MANSRFSWPDGRSVALSLSFDDARPSQVDVTFPLLQSYGVKATFYANPENVETRRDAWREVAAAGHELGNHTVTHPCSINFAFSRGNPLESYSLDRMEQELLDCNRQLQELCGVTPETFAYPCGQTFVGRGAGTQSYVPLIARHFLAGRGFPSEHHNMPLLCDLAQINGCPFDRLPFEVVREWIETARAEGAWLVLAGHDTGDEDRHQMVRSDTLRALCDYALDPVNGVWLDTVAAVARYVKEQQTRKKGTCG